MQTLCFRSECVNTRSAINASLQLVAPRTYVPLFKSQFHPLCTSFSESQGRLQCLAYYRPFIRGPRSRRPITRPYFTRPSIQAPHKSCILHRYASTSASLNMGQNYIEDVEKDADPFPFRSSTPLREGFPSNSKLEEDCGSCAESPAYPMENELPQEINDRLCQTYRTSVKMRRVSRGKSVPILSGTTERKIQLTSSRPYLGLWLDSQTKREQQHIYRRARNSFKNFGTTPYTILLEYLNKSASSVRDQQVNDHTTPILLPLSALKHLRLHGYTAQDLHAWAWAVLSPTADIMAERLFESISRLEFPSFILLELLRRPNLSAKNLKRTLVYCWDLMKGSSQLEILLQSDAQEAVFDRVSKEWMKKQHLIKGRNIAFEESTFHKLICRLLNHARASWPAAVVSIAHMVPAYSQQILQECPNNPKSHHRLYTRTCNLYNTVLQRLSWPTKTHPFRSMTYAWQAQRVLLESARVAGTRQVLLSRASYVAIARVLSASAKSAQEEKKALLMERSWPPWRKELDGMDGKRSVEQDKSRVSLAISQMLEAGYTPDSLTRALGILGGRDVDGTPTIQTRSMVSPFSSSIDEWTARIEATRDAQEAWSAFQSIPAEAKYRLQHYRAMFEKLNAENKRQSKPKAHKTIPGDGKEVMDPMVENLSNYERLRVQPPTVDDLYDLMRKEGVGGIDPDGGCLDLLVATARTFTRGAWYLLDSNLNILGVDMIIGLRPIGSELNSLPESVFVAAIHLICRQARENVIGSPRNANAKVIIEHRYKARAALRKQRRNRLSVTRLPVTDNPLLHALNLLKAWNKPARPPWYTFWKALALKETVISHKLGNSALNHILSWQILEASLEDFTAMGLTIDTAGFRLICICYLKAWLAVERYDSSGGSANEYREKLKKSSQKVKQIFAEITMIGEDADKEERYHLPQMLSEIHFAELHAYLRVLGVLNDKEGILAVADWMVSRKREISRTASTTKNGHFHGVGVIIAMRALIEFKDEETDEGTQTLFSQRLQLLIECVPEFGHWPTDEEAASYRDNWATTIAEESVAP